jgi:hypothetical protein
MQPHVAQRVHDQHAEDLRRLAAQGARNGVKILLTRDGAHVATSASNPSACYRVSVDGCQCTGFGFWRRCQHWALLLSELGLVRDPGAVDCPACAGRGWGAPWRVPGTDAHAVSCRACDGRGWAPVAVVVAAGERRPAAVLAAA